MKKSKIIIMFIICLMLCGCSCEYKLDIANDKIIESATLSANGSEMYSGSYVSDLYKNASVTNIVSLNKKKVDVIDPLKQETKKVDGVGYYTLNFVDGNNATLTANYTYNLSDYNSAETTPSYVQTFSSRMEDGIYVLKISGFNLFDLYPIDNLTIKINSSYEVTYNNADQVNGNTYIWNINKSNYSEKSLKIKFQYKENTKPVSDNEQTTTGFNYKLYLYIGLTVILLGLLAFIIIKGKNNKNNEI